MKVKIFFNKLFKIIKYPLTVLLLYLVFSNIDLHSLSEILNSLNFDLMLTLIFLSIIKITLQFINWHIFLAAFPGNRISFKNSIFAFFSGTSLRIITPGGIGVYSRMLMLPTDKRHSFLAVSYEKIIQTWAITLYAILAIYITYNTLLYLILTLLIFFLPFTLFVIPKNTRYNRYLPKNRLSVIPNSAVQLLINFITVFQYYIYLGNFADFDFSAAIMTVPLVQFANLIPITVSGLGLREHIAMSIYPKFFISSELAISCSLFIFAISNLVPAIIGVILLLFFRHKSDKNN